MNNNYVISTDSTCDFPIGFSKDINVEMLYWDYEINGESKIETDNLDDKKEIYKAIRAGYLPKTAQLNPTKVKEHFEPFLKDGKDIIHVLFSSGLTGSKNSMLMAIKELSEMYPDRKMLVLDTLQASAGQGLMVYHATQRRDEGFSIDELYNWLDERVQNYCAYFTVDDLTHLHRGGRVSKISAVLGSMLSIKPGLHVNEEGKLINIDKVRGRQQALDWLVKKMGEKTVGVENDIVFISHGDCEEDAEYVKNQIKKLYKVKKFVISYIGSVIGTHAGPGTVALFFVGTDRKEGK